MTDKEHMSTLTDDIHVTRWGTEGPEVLMIHGGPQGSSLGGVKNFDRQKPLADEGWQLVVPDRPGHGKTPSRGPEDMDVDAVWIAEMLGDGAHLVGHSYGGCCALAAAALRPDAVKSLTLIEAPVFSAAADDPAAVEFLEAINAAYDKAQSPGEFLMSFATMVRIPYDEIGGDPPSAEELTALGEGLRTLHQPQVWDSTEQLAVVRDHKIPVLAATGNWSPGEEAISDGLARVLNGERLVVDTQHHFVQYGQEEFNAAFGRFIRMAEAKWGD